MLVCGINLHVSILPNYFLSSHIFSMKLIEYLLSILFSSIHSPWFFEQMAYLSLLLFYKLWCIALIAKVLAMPCTRSNKKLLLHLAWHIGYAILCVKGGEWSAITQETTIESKRKITNSNRRERSEICETLKKFQIVPDFLSHIFWDWLWRTNKVSWASWFTGWERMGKDGEDWVLK